MPAYNAERYISAAIESVLRQTYLNWELIVMDDCSVDGTPEIVKEFLDERIRYYRNEKNVGVAQTRNLGIRKSLGTWIAFLDSDDLWEPQKLEKQVGFVRRNREAKLVFTSSAFINEEGERLEYILRVPDKVTKKQLLKQNILSCSSILVDKSCMSRYQFPYRESIHEDFVTWLQLLDEIGCAYGLAEPLLIYRISVASKSGNKIKAAKMQWNAYKEYGLNVFQSLYYMFFYIVNGLKKYSQISV